MPKPDDLMTPAAWGRTRGLSRQGAHSAITRLGIPREPDGRISKVVADTVYAARSRPHVRARPSKQVAPPEFGAAAAEQEALIADVGHWRARHERSKALRGELALAAESGKFVELAPLAAVLERQLRVFRARLLAIPDRCAQEAPADHDLRVSIQGTVSRLIDEALTDLAEGHVEILEIANGNERDSSNP